MDLLLESTLALHILSGFIALFTAPVAMVTKKGGQQHLRYGKVYFWAMTSVFITAVVLSTIKWIPFLFMIAFLSYYAVFSGVRILYLKKLGQGQKAQWYDWLAAVLTAIAMLAFVAWGLYYIVVGVKSFFLYLAIGFGLLGFGLVIRNIRPFITKPGHKQFWWFLHMGNMLGGFIATLTAFSTTIFGYFEISHFLVWAWPALVGVPGLRVWRRHYEKKFGIA